MSGLEFRWTIACTQHTGACCATSCYTSQQVQPYFVGVHWTCQSGSYQPGSMFHLKSQLLRSILSEKKSTILLAWSFVWLCAISLSALVHSGSRRPQQNCYQLRHLNISPVTHGIVCQAQFEIVTVCVRLNLNLKRTFLNKTSFYWLRAVATWSSARLRIASCYMPRVLCFIYLLTYLLTYLYSLN